MDNFIKIDINIEDGCIEILGFEIPICMDRDDLQGVLMDVISKLNDFEEVE